MCSPKFETELDPMRILAFSLYCLRMCGTNLSFSGDFKAAFSAVLTYFDLFFFISILTRYYSAADVNISALIYHRKQARRNEKLNNRRVVRSAKDSTRTSTLQALSPGGSKRIISKHVAINSSGREAPCAIYLVML